MRGSDAWSPTGVAIFGGDILVLEYGYVETTRREDWLPRARKISREGTVPVLATLRGNEIVLPLFFDSSNLSREPDHPQYDTQ